MSLVRTQSACALACLLFSSGCVGSGGVPGSLHPAVLEFRRAVVAYQEAANREMGWPPGDRSGIAGEPPSTETWRRAMDRIKGAGEHAVESLCTLLGDADAAVRVKTAEALEELANPVTVAALPDHLEDSDHWTQQHIIKALGAIGDRRAVGPLSDLLMNSRNGDACFAAFHILLEWQDPRAREALNSFIPEYPTIFMGEDIVLMKKLGCTGWQYTGPEDDAGAGKSTP